MRLSLLAAAYAAAMSNAVPEARAALASLPYSQNNGSHPFRSRGGKVRTRSLGERGAEHERKTR
jgi:hypothetical protein